MKTINWKEFELLIAEIHRSASPGAVVQHNHRIRGSSGSLRQIDVTISQTVGLYSALIAIECKKYRRPVNLDKVEAFATKLKDIHASHGVMISTSSFDEGARNVAKQHGITLLTYREASEIDWYTVTNSEAWLKLLFSKFEIESTEIRYATEDADYISPNTNLLSEDGQPFTTIGELQKQAMESQRPFCPPGELILDLSIEPPLYLQSPNGLSKIESFQLHGREIWREYLVNLSLAFGHVLDNAHDRQAILQQMTTQSWDIEELLRSQSGREVSQEEFDEMQQGNVGRIFLRPIPAANIKRFMRLVITKKAKLV